MRRLALVLMLGVGTVAHAQLSAGYGDPEWDPEDPKEDTHENPSVWDGGTNYTPQLSNGVPEVEDQWPSTVSSACAQRTYTLKDDGIERTLGHVHVIDFTCESPPPGLEAGQELWMWHDEMWPDSFALVPADQLTANELVSSESIVASQDVFELGLPLRSDSVPVGPVDRFYEVTRTGDQDSETVAWFWWQPWNDWNQVAFAPVTQDTPLLQVAPGDVLEFRSAHPDQMPARVVQAGSW